jgi:ERCC4-type nuclease
MKLVVPSINREVNPGRFKIPPGFFLIQDTREQRPLYAPGEIKGLEVISGTLTHGDYSIKGFECLFAVERKQVSDFFTYIGKDRVNTTHKVEGFKEIIFRGGFAALVVEASEADLLSGFILSRVHPEAVRQSLVSFEVRYGIHSYFSRSRVDCARWILDRAIKFYKIQSEVSNETEKGKYQVNGPRVHRVGSNQGGG